MPSIRYNARCLSTKEVQPTVNCATETYTHTYRQTDSMCDCVFVCPFVCLFGRGLDSDLLSHRETYTEARTDIYMLTYAKKPQNRPRLRARAAEVE